MPKPLDYKRSIDIAVDSVDRLKPVLDPRRWSENAPLIWQHSYLVRDERALSEDPNQAPQLDQQLAKEDVWDEPLPALLFEEVLFGGFRYRNLLAVTFEHPNEDTIRFRYTEDHCLTTHIEGEGDVNGGVDVDSGLSEARRKGESKMVTITISKKVRFTQPARYQERLNALAEMSVPVALDHWLHHIIFRELGKV